MSVALSLELMQWRGYCTHKELRESYLSEGLKKKLQGQLSNCIELDGFYIEKLKKNTQNKCVFYLFLKTYQPVLV